MQKLDLLTKNLSKHFSIHPSRQKTLAAMIYGLLCSKNVHQQSLSLYTESPTPQAGLRKVERFFAEETLSSADFARAIVELLGFKKNLISVLIERTGNLAQKISTTSFSVGGLTRKFQFLFCLWNWIKREIPIQKNALIF